MATRATYPAAILLIKFALRQLAVGIRECSMSEKIVSGHVPAIWKDRAARPILRPFRLWHSEVGAGRRLCCSVSIASSCGLSSSAPYKPYSMLDQASNGTRNRSIASTASANLVPAAAGRSANARDTPGVARERSCGQTCERNGAIACSKSSAGDCFSCSEISRMNCCKTSAARARTSSSIQRSVC